MDVNELRAQSRANEALLKEMMITTRSSGEEPIIRGNNRPSK